MVARSAIQLVALTITKGGNVRVQEFIDGAMCNVMVATAMRDALRSLEVIHQAGVVIVGQEGAVDGGGFAVDFSMEILKLKAALHVMGLEEDEG